MRSRYEAEYRQLILFAIARRRGEYPHHHESIVEEELADFLDWLSYARSTAPRDRQVTNKAWVLIIAVYLAGEKIVRLIPDGTVITTRLDRKATTFSVLAAIGVRRDGQKVLLPIRNMGGESTAAWSQSSPIRTRGACRGPNS